MSKEGNARISLAFENSLSLILLDSLNEQLLLLWKYTERKINLKKLSRCRLGQLWKSRKMKAPPNKLAYREDGNRVCQTGKCGIAFGQQVNSKRMKKHLTEKLSNDKERNGKHFVRTYMYFHSCFYFLEFFSVVFRTKYAGC